MRVASPFAALDIEENVYAAMLLNRIKQVAHAEGYGFDARAAYVSAVGQHQFQVSSVADMISIERVDVARYEEGRRVVRAKRGKSTYGFQGVFCDHRQRQFTVSVDWLCIPAIQPGARKLAQAAA